MLVGEHRLGSLGGMAEDYQKLASQVQDLLAKTPDITSLATHVLEDPALPALLQRIRMMRQIEEANRLANRDEPSKPAVGVGLTKVIAPLDTLIYVRRKPWVPYAVVGLALVFPLAVGFGFGRLVRRR